MPMHSPCLAPAFLAAASLVFTAAVPAQSVGIKLVHGTNGFLEVANSPTLVPPSGITVEAWITYDDATLQTGWAWPTLVRQNQAPGQESYFLRVDAAQTSVRRLRWKVVTSTGLQVAAFWDFQPGQLLTWTHVAATYDGATARLYINGAEVSQGTGSGAIRDLGGTLRIGKGDDATGNGEVWNGEIDEFRLWPFARTAAEILASRNQELAGFPGKVATWNLNGNPLDSSGGILATVQGTVTYQNNSLSLGGLTSPFVLAYGASSPGCKGNLDATLTALPQIGNAAFALASTRGPANGTGALLISAQRLATPLRALGVDLWVDPAAPFVTLGASTGVLGAGRVGIGIPASPGLQGVNFAAQFVWVDGCGSQGLTASDAVAVTIR